jgi:hypothetical protein
VPYVFSAPRWLNLDRDARYGNEVFTAIRHTGAEPKQITTRGPRRNHTRSAFSPASSRAT